MPRYTVPVVFDVEVEPPMPLGIYTLTDEDTVSYRDPQGRTCHAPADCVLIVTVPLVVGTLAGVED